MALTFSHGYSRKGVIPVSKHWDPAKLVSIKVANLMLRTDILMELRERLDSSVKHWKTPFFVRVTLTRTNVHTVMHGMMLVTSLAMSMMKLPKNTL